MRIALDTNVLVRYLAWDDEAQSKLAAEAIENATSVLVAPIVLCETVRVLKRAYRLDSVDIATTLRQFIESETVEVDRQLAEAGLGTLIQGGDFADGVIFAEAERARADALVTFDQEFATRTNSARLRLLGQPRGVLPAKT